ncbi:fungal-specific transcription factor domain-containing protein [Annulohypoxylon maeteangense]|uniref:fungal-specific transcription factor domain-containing protein n=1 Tax=Annulohypoxylon maeteangense TaxID=1927788 RepID=UPI0020079D5C|nr:fungal-specific transcription factor domain-containing protein [Annulohypoxylon maeteangense]KAI0888128.1 fungal-specific transcription factor domain-containing protein [Annulohypoxylon maeteangense]
MGDPMHSRSPNRALSTRLSRSTNACVRCRRRKQRCDLRYPKCSSCETAQVPCLAYDSEKQAEIPRNYVSILESEVRQLKSELENLRRQSVSTTIISTSPIPAVQDEHQSVSSPIAAPTVQSTTSDPQEVVKSMGLVMLDSGSQPKFMGTSSGVTFAKMVLACVKTDITIPLSPTTSRGSYRMTAPPPIITSSLPPRHAAQHISDVYFRYRTPHVPILIRSKVNDVLGRVYGVFESHRPDFSGVAEGDLFIAYMVFAVGLCSLPVAGGSRPPQSEGCFNSALRCVDKLLSYSSNDLDTLTVVLLLAQYIALNPSKGSLWQLTGIAIRLCIDLGLHWETEAMLALPQAALNERRRLFWAAYRFDRLLAVTLGRPFGIVDQSISVGFPEPSSAENSSPTEVHSQRMANHIIDIYKLESEIKHVLYHQLQGPTLAYPRADYALWFRDIQPRLRAWKDEIPDISKADPESIYSHQVWWDAMWLNAVLLLHRPNPLVPHPTAESLQTCFDAACQLIKAIKTLQRDGRICVIWQTVHGLFLAGLIMIYCIWESADVRDKGRILDIVTTAQDCASTLTALAERFPDACGCRDAFESLSAATLKWLVARDQGNTASQPTPSEINALKQNMPFSTAAWRAEEPTSIFPDEPFEFAEYLIAASQWPGSNNDVGNSFNLQDVFDSPSADFG